MTESDRQHLAAFRAAALQVRNSSVIAKGSTVILKGEFKEAERAKLLEVTADLIDSEPFRSLALSVRLVYQSGEPANFGHICNIVARAGNAALTKRSMEQRKRFQSTLTEHNPLSVLFGLVRPDEYSPRDMFEAWLYYGVFHQDPSRRDDFLAMAALGDVFPYTVQVIVLQLAGRVLDLDDIVAELLGEAALPRIAPSSEAA